jgi:hypothetical protein
MAVENNNIISSYQAVLSISTSPLVAESNNNCTGSHSLFKEIYNALLTGREIS